MQYSVKFVKNFIVKQFKNSTHKILTLNRIEKMVLIVLLVKKNTPQIDPRERGKAGGHEPPLFPLPYHHIWLFRAKLLFWMVYLWPLKCDFKKSSRVTQSSTTQTFFSIKVNILCVEFLNCFTMKFLTNLTEYCILKYHKF